MEQSQPCSNSSSRGGQKRTRHKGWAKSTLQAKLVSTLVLGLSFLPVLSWENIIHINCLLPSGSWKSNVHCPSAFYFPSSWVDGKDSWTEWYSGLLNFITWSKLPLPLNVNVGRGPSPLNNCMQNFPLAKILSFLYKGLMLSLIRSSAFIYTGIHPVTSWRQWNDAVFTPGVNGVFITLLKGILQCINPKEQTIPKRENLLMNDGKVTEMLNVPINNSLRATNLFPLQVLSFLSISVSVLSVNNTLSLSWAGEM